MSEKLQGLIRHILTVAGGMLVAKGWIDETTMVTAVGGLAGLIGFVWSWLAPEKQA